MSTCTYYFQLLKTRLRDQFQQNWHENVTNLFKLGSYIKNKDNFEFEKYLDIQNNDHFIKLFASLRLFSHSLAIETGRYVRKTEKIEYVRIAIRT